MELKTLGRNRYIIFGLIGLMPMHGSLRKAGKVKGQTPKIQGNLGLIQYQKFAIETTTKRDLGRRDNQGKKPERKSRR